MAKNKKLRQDILWILSEIRKFDCLLGYKQYCGRGYGYSDEDYYGQLSDRLEWISRRFRIDPINALKTVYSIMNDLYVARCITLDDKAVVEALDKLDNITNSRTNDHNGEYTDVDMIIQEYKVMQQLQKDCGIV